MTKQVNKLIPVAFPLFPTKENLKSNQMKALIQEYVDGAASSDHDNHYKSKTLDQSLGIGNLSLTFPNYTTPIEN